jgi:hypothetical protein
MIVGFEAEEVTLEAISKWDIDEGPIGISTPLRRSL